MTVGSSLLSRLLMVLVALIATVFLAGRMTPSSFSTQEVVRVAEGEMSSDGWVGQRAEFTWSGYAPAVNQFAVSFSPVRPGATESAKVAVAACDGPEQEVIVTSDAPIKVRISFGCSPARLVVRALNFFSPPGERSARTLGVQLRAVEISSPLGVPVASLDSLAYVGAFILATILVAGFLGKRVGISSSVSGFAMLAIVGAFVLGVSADPEKLQPLGIVFLAGLLGIALYERGDDRESESRGGARYLPWIALAVGATLRLYGIRFGLPSNFHPDEVPKVNAIMRMVGSQTLDPQYFLHPSLLLYCTYGMNTVLHAVGIEGSFRETAFFAGRLVSATAGIASIALTYQIGKRVFSREVGGIAACLLAVFPLHVTCSRYLKEDALLTFVVLSCVLVTIVAVQSQRRWMLLFAGLLAGCTAGAKYSGILMVVVPASAPWLASKSWKPDIRWLPWVVAAVAIAPLGFLCTTPYAVLNSAKFIKDFSSESRHMQTGHTVAITAWSQLWMYHVWRSIWPGISGFTTVIGCVAVGYLVRRGRINDLFIVGLLLLFYLPAEYVKAKPAPQPERYILPCLPFLALAIGELLTRMSRHKGAARLAVAGCAAAVFALPLYRTVTLAGDVTNDTRDQMVTWMKSNVPAGAKVLMDWKPYCPNFHGQHVQVENITRAEILESLQIDTLKNSGADYLILSSLFYNRYFSQPGAKAAQRQRFREVFQKVPVVVQFEAPSGTYGFHNPTLTLFSLKAEDFARLEDELSKKKRGEVQYTSNEVRAQAKW